MIQYTVCYQLEVWVESAAENYSLALNICQAAAETAGFEANDFEALGNSGVDDDADDADSASNFGYDDSWSFYHVAVVDFDVVYCLLTDGLPGVQDYWQYKQQES